MTLRHFALPAGIRQAPTQVRPAAALLRTALLAALAGCGVILLLMTGAAASSSGPRLGSGAQMVAGTSMLSDIACVDASTCLAVGETGQSHSTRGAFVLIQGGKAGPAVDQPGTAELTGVACPNASRCELVGNDDTGDHGAAVWTSPDGVPERASEVSASSALNGIACSSATTCFAAGRGNAGGGVVVRITDGLPGSSWQVANTSSLSSIACPTATTCFAVGANSTTTAGIVVRITSGGPGAAEAIPGTSTLSGIACRSTTTCLVVGAATDHRGGVLVPLLSGEPGPAEGFAAADFSGIGCPTTTTCLAVGSGNPGPGTGAVVPVVANTPGSPQLISGANSLDGLACPSASLCEAVGRNSNGGRGVLVLGPFVTTATSLTSSADPAKAGETLVYTARVSPTPNAGTVTFTDGGTPVPGCAGKVISGAEAGCTVSYRSPASYDITAEYSGDVAYAPSTSPYLTQTVIGVPGPPGHLVATAGDGVVALAWSPPVSDGGSAVRGYDVYDATGPSGTFRNPVDSSAMMGGTSDRVGGLVNGTTYHFVVEAMNAAGHGPPSAEVSATPVSLAPPAPVKGTPGPARGVSSPSARSPGTSATKHASGGTRAAATRRSTSEPAGAGQILTGTPPVPAGATNPTIGESAPGQVPTGRHASIATFGYEAYANGGRGPDVDYARSVGTGLYGGPPGYAPLAQGVPTPLDLSWRPAHLLGNVGLAALLLLLLALPAELFNLTLRAHRDRIASSPSTSRQIVRGVEAFFEGLPPLVAYAGLVVVGAVLYAIADPTFGFDRSSLAEVVGFVGAIAITNGVLQFGRGWYLNRRYHQQGRFRVMPLGIVIALVLVVFSRLGHFEPGYVFGVFAVLSFTFEPPKEETGRSYAVVALWLLGISGAIWFAWIPVRHAVDSGHTGLGFLILDSLFAMGWICGVQAIIFAYLPLQHFNGSSVMAWSRKAWLALYGFTMFVFVETILHPTGAGLGANRHATLVSILYPFLGFAAFAATFWVYCRLRYGPVAAPEPDVSELATSRQG
jgi:Bacterial Ig-like domain (group 3)/Fibronectin type III domain